MGNREARTQNREPGARGALSALDDGALVERLDRQGLLGRIEGLPEQCAEAWQAAQGSELPAGYGAARQLVVLGMGGSAIAGDLVRALAALSGHKPVSVVRGYDLPPFVGADALVVACSHSGKTEETLAAFKQALSAGAKTAVVSTGGPLVELGRKADARILDYEYQEDGEPRSALGHQLMRLLAIAERAGVLPPQGEAVDEAVALMRAQRERLGFASPAAQNPAKQLAGRLVGRLPVIIGTSVLAEAAHRWKTQLNENSKCWALWEELPELDHNSIAGFGLPKEVVERLHVVFLWHAALHRQVLRRYDATAEELSAAGVSHERLEVAGSSPLAQVLSAVYFGDLASYYLALLNGVEPSPVAAIDRLKARLAGS